ncbi:hypothetical protein GIB67_024854 [Kingdonia uniflora]|uniref:Pectinesterase n=1 Tax=Kingdonia uniflora TaxID=39325 RepID=A0A7J7NZ22_9MAGN|nr:hypothetical protein GIB67_024854 [Kingdonia uniflora]
MMGKVAAVGVSLILVVGVIVGVIASVSHNNSGNGAPAASTSSSGLSAGMKAVQTICAPTDYKEACISSLTPVAQNGTNVTPKVLLQAAFEATMTEVNKALDKSGSIGKGYSNDAIQKMAMEDCDELLKFAIDELQASISMVGDNDMHTISDRAAEFQNWLSAVISYQQTCLDGITNPELKSAMTNGLLNATQFTSNALAVVGEITDFLKTFNIPLPLNTSSITNSIHSRRLLETNVDNKGYPNWLSAGDRRLLASSNNRARPNAVVAKDGSGQFKTISAAIEAYPKNHRGRYVIYVKAGVYDEYIIITKEKVNIFMYGDGPRKTIVTGRKSNAGGYSTFRTATFSAIAAGFICKSMGFQNTAGPEGHQAVALRVQSDMAVFFNCRMDGYQDTLYTQAHRQFYRNCVISGTVDFIFGDASVVIQNSLIIARKPMDNQKNTVTAHGRSERHETTGLIIHNCRIVPEQKLFAARFKTPTYLGRPWKEYSRTVVMESTLGDFINPKGWLPWAGNFALDTLFYAEYANRGQGAVTTRRVQWKGYKVITNKREAQQFTVAPFIQGNLWLKYAGVPYLPGLKR